MDWAVRGAVPRRVWPVPSRLDDELGRRGRQSGAEVGLVQSHSLHRTASPYCESCLAAGERAPFTDSRRAGAWRARVPGQARSKKPWEPSIPTIADLEQWERSGDCGRPCEPTRDHRGQLGAIWDAVGETRSPLSSSPQLAPLFSPPLVARLRALQSRARGVLLSQQRGSGSGRPHADWA